MGKPKKTKTAKRPAGLIASDIVQDAFAALDKFAPDASILDESALSIVSGFVDSGCYALNGILSGQCRTGGIPSGRIVVFAGPSGCGKTVMCAKTIANAQKTGRIAVVFDSEIAFDKQTALNCGCDPSRIKHVPVETVEQVKQAAVTMLDGIIKNPSLRGKFIFILDSLANCSTEKEIGDAQKGHTAADMGLRAKQIKSMLRTLTYKCAKADVPMLITNHIYDDPSALFDSIKKNQGGGRGPEYLASIIVQMAAKQERAQQGGKKKKKGEEDDDDEQEAPVMDAKSIALGVAKEATGGSVVGLALNMMTTKNRFLPPFLEVTATINFVTGFQKYSGLFDLAKAMGVITGAKTYSLSDGTSLGYRKDIEDNADLWENTILSVLDEALAAKFKFSCEAPLIDDTETE